MSILESPIASIARKVFGTQKSGWIGIDIGSGSIKIAQVQKQNHSWELLSHQILPLVENNSSNSSHQMNNDAQPICLVEKCIQILKQKTMLFSLFNGRKAAALLPMSIAQLQSINLPNGTPSELQMMIQSDLEMQSSDQIVENEFVFWKENFSKLDNDETVQASVVSAPRHEILQVANQLFKMSVQCEMVNVLPIVLARAVQLRDEIPQETVQSVFDWGTTSPLFTIVQNGAPIYSRVFRDCGFGKVIQLLQNRMGLTHQESLHLLKTYQSSEHPDEMKPIARAISELIVAPMKMLSREFRKTLDYIKQKTS